ncbi:hypothetical protein J5S49_05010 [Virgibacillus halodenitrificans]|uniref:DUF1433 domain-containing protein n=1 Tax=Virgibacillus halodenitrificans TaxID=1482 RepID=A0AAC9NME4_VIRHA|nr:membrane lipoprotein lipid attachment site-containing protein [Virgibacillus halodenitrificans]APC50065.1 hypothetical protein BME96_18480 [Virgibacillus halodenitrificans]MCG1027642.1 hypothetical protein [Virgibacillus halodenitrificans]MEC2157682.1 membrane lipoprotein lipid attachment site-containing protein [Virgibacillus halodenitrificans]CDQ31877.1 hypothetical protein BN993_01262 [Virgibacillus halodenitrificans]
MKKIFFIIAFVILLASCNLNSGNEIEDEINVDKAKKNVEDYLFKNFEDIKSVEINDIYVSQMGGIAIDGTVNGHAEYTAGIESDLNVNSMGVSEAFPNRKEECKYRRCD